MRTLLLTLALALPATAGNPSEASSGETIPDRGGQARAGAITVGGARSDADPVAVPEPSERALRYYQSGMWLWLVGRLWALAVPAAILWSGLSGRLRDVAWRLGRRWPVALALYAVLYLTLDWVLDRPLAFYAGFVRPHAYGLSNQTFLKWLGDSAKGLAVTAVAAAAFLWVPYGLMARSPRRWWLWTGLLSVPWLCFVMLVTPVVVDPLFNDFGPMKDKGLEGEILALARRAGIEGSRVFEVDKSRDTKTVNAYVTGFGGTKRIVLWDTLLATMDRREVLFIMGHEMGHYVLGHVARSILASSLLTLAGLYFVHRASGPLIRRYARRFRFDRLADFASLPLVVLLIQAFALVAEPVANAYSRRQEHEADRFALELTRDNRAGATSFVKLQRENLGNPRPGWIYRTWRGTHPSLGERVDFCNTYRPWTDGGPLTYGHLFHAED